MDEKETLPVAFARFFANPEVQAAIAARTWRPIVKLANTDKPMRALATTESGYWTRATLKAAHAEWSSASA